jgi:arginase
MAKVDQSVPGRRLKLLGAACGLGFPDHGCALAPDEVRRAGNALWLRPGGQLAWEGTVRVADVPDEKAPAAIAAFNRKLAQRVARLAGKDDLLVVMGGDHAIAPGTWSGVRHALDGPLGLLWIDAHLDAHTPETTHTGNIHGMPLAALLGHGPKRFTHVLQETPVLDPSHVAVVGMRSREPQEAALLAGLGVRVMDMQEVGRRGLREVLAEAVEIAGGDTAGFGISLDMDAIDTEDAPGVNTPVTGGIPVADLVEALRALRLDARLSAVEIAEYNPTLDRDGATLRCVLDLIAALAPEAGESHPLRREETLQSE